MMVAYSPNFALSNDDLHFNEEIFALWDILIDR